MSFAYITYAPSDLDALLQVHEALRKASIADAYAPPSAGADLPAAPDPLEQAFCLIVLVSADAQKSAQVRSDVEQAIARGMTILPVRVDKSRLGGSLKRDIGPLLSHDALSPEALARFIEAVQARYRRRCPVIAVMNLKGGVGKTTVSAQVFGAFQHETRGRVLLIDFDPQYNLTQHFFTMAEADSFGMADRSVISLFERSRIHYPDAISPAEQWSAIITDPFDPAPRRQIARALLPSDMRGWLDIIPGQFEISKYAFSTDAEALAVIRQNFLRVIDKFRSEYDLIVFDTNPNATFLTTCAMEAADRILAPMHADEFSLRGVKLLNSLIQSQLTEETRPELLVLFNSVARNEQSEFEADARAGAFDGRVEFELSKRLMQAALPRSNHFQVHGRPDADIPPHQRLLVHHGRGGGLKQTRDRLLGVVLELQKSLPHDE